MQLIIRLNGTSREIFEKHLQSWNWQTWGWFKFAQNNKNVIIARKEDWDFDIRVCFMGNGDYDYFVQFTPLREREDLFEKEPWLLDSLVKDFAYFINVDYHRDIYDSVTCELIQ